MSEAPAVIALSSSPGHSFSKQLMAQLTLIAGLGVEGDAHCGALVKHRSRVKADPTQPNLRQVHLVAAEFLDELAAGGFDIRPGDMGENITTRGLALIDLPRGARLRIGASALIEITGLRNPCYQLDDFRPGLMKACLGRGEDGRLILKTGIMGVVLAGGVIATDDPIELILPQGPHHRLERV